MLSVYTDVCTYVCMQALHTYVNAALLYTTKKLEFVVVIVTLWTDFRCEKPDKLKRVL